MAILKGAAAASTWWQRFRHGWLIVGRYWVGKDWPWAWSFLLILIATQYTFSSVLLALANWEKSFFDMLQTRHGTISSALMVYIGIVGMLAVQSFFQHFVVGYLGLRWRTWLNDEYANRWVNERAYYHIERDQNIDNPDQRIAEDCALMADGILSLLSGFIVAFVNIWKFGPLLLEKSGVLAFNAFGYQFHIPGDLLICTILYAIFTAAVAMIAGRPLISRTVRQQHYEADYRFSLIRIRNKAEQIAMIGSESIESAILKRKFSILRRNKRQMVLASSGLDGVQSLFGLSSSILPLVVLMNRFFSGGITIGDLMQARTAAGQFSNSLAWFMRSYGSIAAIVAVIARLRAFEEAFEILPAPIHGAAPLSPVQLSVHSLQLSLPDGTHLLAASDWEVRKGERWVVRGSSGAGKSTLLRSIAGLWPHCSGVIKHCDNVMFLPQKTYLPLGSLRQAICCPSMSERIDEKAVVDVLQVFNLTHLLPRLDEDAAWEDILSLGEQQRIAAARVLLQRPTVLVMDEATSALDGDNAALVYRKIIAAIPDITIISVVHDDQLEQFHDHILRLNAAAATPAALQKRIER